MMGGDGACKAACLIGCDQESPNRHHDISIQLNYASHVVTNILQGKIRHLSPKRPLGGGVYVDLAPLWTSWSDCPLPGLLATLGSLGTYSWHSLGATPTAGFRGVQNPFYISY